VGLDFVNLSGAKRNAETFALSNSGRNPERFSRFSVWRNIRTGEADVSDVAANWKITMENYQRVATMRACASRAL